jgi:diguanylate cyclase (GGDEF)-like protein
VSIAIRLGLGLEDWLSRTNVAVVPDLVIARIDANQMNTGGWTNVRILSADQSRQLLDVHRDAARPLSANALRPLAVRVSEILDVKTAFIARIDATWVVLAESAIEPRLPAAGAEAWRALDRRVAAAQKVPQAWRHEETDWTLVALRGASGIQPLLALEDDWTLSSPTLQLFASTLRVAERAVRSPSQTQAGLTAHRLTRALGRTRGLESVCAVVLRHCVRAVPSRLASFAVATDEGHLRIVATQGYPLELVDQLRITTGTGIIGGVYRDRAPLCVEDVSELEPRRRRPRYRTGSFMAVPVVAGGEALGVVCVSDRLDDRAFNRKDLAKIRALTAPAALALERERAKRQADEFARAAIIDPVSGLYNRRYFHDRLDEELQRASRQRTTVALLMIDIDDFKRINDRFGHMAGDTVIKGVSDILRRSVRKFDLCTRFGGEEFAIVMPGSGVEGAASIAERIRQRIEAFRADERELSQLRVTASIGLSVAEDALSRELIVRADRALYSAKRAGKNRVVSGSADFLAET